MTDEFEFLSGRSSKQWGDLCEKCPDRVRKAVDGCVGDGCVRIMKQVDRFRSTEKREVILYRMHCWHCRQWTPVYPGDGWRCGMCGLDCSYASSLLAGSKNDPQGRVIDGILLADEEDDY